MWARFITTDYVALLFFAVLFHVYGGDAQTDSPCEGCENKLKTYQISLYSVSAVGVESSNDPEQQIKDARPDHHKGRISYYELGKLVRYAFEENEDDELEEAMKSLMNDDNYVFPKSKYGATDVDQYHVYQDLCHWKKRCVNQIELLFAECIDADMVKSLRQLTDLRGRVLDVPSSFSSDLKRILRLIGEKSADNITNLLKNLNVENVDCDHFSGLQEIVDGALQKLEIWKEGVVPMNPVVMLNLALEDLNLSQGRNEHLLDVESISWTME